MAGATNREERWLAVAEEAFVPFDSGGRVESIGILRSALRAGVELTVVVPGVEDGRALRAHRDALPDAEIVGVPRRTGFGAHLSTAPYVFASRRIARTTRSGLLDAHARRPWSAVLAVSFRAAQTGLALARDMELPLVVRAHNVESDYFSELARTSRWPRSAAYRWESRKLRRAEAALHRADEIAVFADISRADADRRRTRTRRPVMYLPPFLPDVAVRSTVAETPSVGRRPVVLFVGSLDNANNVSGLSWYVNRCRPLVDVDAEMHVVGRRASPSLRDELATAGVRLTADAPAVEPHLAEAAVVINPVRGGSGVNIKMVEAMAAGRAVVSTHVGARGLHWRDGEHYLRADDATAFAAAVSRLLRSDAMRLSMGSAARRFVSEELDGVRLIHRLVEGLRA